MGDKYVLAREKNSFITYFFMALCGFIFSGLLIYIMNGSVMYVTLGIILLILSFYYSIIMIGCLTGKPIILIDDQDISFRANLYSIKERLQLKDIKNCEYEDVPQGEVTVPAVILYLNDNSKRQIKCSGADDNKVASFVEVINGFLRGDDMTNEQFIRSKNSVHSNISQVLKKTSVDNNIKEVSTANDTESFGSSGTAFFGWIVLQIIAFAIAMIHLSVYTEVLFKSNSMGLFYGITVSIFVFLLLTELNYQILYGFGWHSISKGAEIDSYSQGSYKFPIFISNTSKYLTRRDEISSRAKNLQLVYTISRIVIGSLIGGGIAQLAIFLRKINTGTDMIFIAIAAGAVLLVFFLICYGDIFAYIFKLHIIQVENLRPHFDDKEE
ncbi:hypothetical protein [Companilactobacillus jidongensis]|uniref:hypothetical protein n=1 Tax=Companilactobacillus jidongensis TaxID=2486006 RepID=UPI000F7A18A3|nr:hypothetical protein [Companilactobacillus jidongensis]